MPRESIRSFSYSTCLVNKTFAKNREYYLFSSILYTNEPSKVIEPLKLTLQTDRIRLWGWLQREGFQVK